MMYPFMTLNDDTEITHSEMKPDGRVKCISKHRMILVASTVQSVGCLNTNGKNFNRFMFTFRKAVQPLTSQTTINLMHQRLGTLSFRPLF